MSDCKKRYDNDYRVSRNLEPDGEDSTAFINPSDNCRGEQPNKPMDSPLGTWPSYPLPPFLQGICTQPEYYKWLVAKASTLFKRDRTGAGGVVAFCKKVARHAENRK